MFIVYFLSGDSIQVSHDDFIFIREAIDKKERFVRLYDDIIEIINIDNITHIVELA